MLENEADPPTNLNPQDFLTSSLLSLYFEMMISPSFVFLYPYLHRECAVTGIMLFCSCTELSADHGEPKKSPHDEGTAPTYRCDQITAL